MTTVRYILIFVLSFALTTSCKKPEKNNEATSAPESSVQTAQAQKNPPKPKISAPEIEPPQKKPPVKIGSRGAMVPEGEIMVEKPSRKASPKKRDPKIDEFMMACYYGRIAKVKMMLEQYPDLIKARGFAGATCLHEAARGGQYEVCEYLINKGADINATNEGNKTPLFFASRESSLDVIKLLVENEADVNAKGEDGYTPLHQAVMNKSSYEATKLLLDHGAKLDEKGRNGRTPLHVSVFAEEADTMSLLLEYGADVNAQEKQGWTPLHYICKGGRSDHQSKKHMEKAQVLLDHDADINVKDRNGYTPLDIAVMFRNSKMEEFLRERGAVSGRE